MADSKQIELELDKLEKSITLLKRDYEIFFAGASKLPPHDVRIRLEKAIKKMAMDQGMSYAMRFRYNSIAARFNSYLDLWNKQIRLKEEGRSGVRISGISQETKRIMEQSQKVEAREEPHESKTREMPTDPFAKVYSDYLSTREELGEGAPSLSLEGFVKVVSKQREEILQKFHCKDVEFYVAVEKGHTKLKARPVK